MRKQTAHIAPAETLPGRPLYRPQIDGVRALAVTAVLFFHLGFGWIPGGFAGVDVFFVLSGYLISGLLITEANRRRSVSLTRFYARRARRLLPAAWLVVVFSVLVGREMYSPIDYENLRRHAVSAVLYMANWDWATVEHGYFATDREPSPLIHFWSLAVEEQFYFLWPALVLVCIWIARRFSGPLLAVVGAAFALISTVSMALAVNLTPSAAAYYGTHTRAFQLGVGGMVAVLMERRSQVAGGHRPRTGRDRTLALGLAGAGLLGLVWLMLTVTGSSDYPGWSAVWVTASSALLIAGVDLADGTVPALIFGSFVPMWIGRLSYSIYLWHWPLIVFWKDSLGTVGIVAATMSAATASYFLLEQPVRRRLLPGTSPWKVAAVGVAISGILGLLVVPSLLRNSPRELQVIAARHDVAEPPEHCPYGFRTWPSPERSDVCHVLRGSGPRVLLVGDSHAEMWAPALQVLAHRADWDFATLARARCPAADFTWARSGEATDEATRGEICTDWRRIVYPAVSGTYHPDFVIIGSRSQIYEIRDGSRVVGRRDPDYASLWRGGWARTIDLFSASGARVLVLAPVPTLPPSSLDCVATSDSGCDFDASQDEQTMRALRRLTHLVNHTRGAELIDVFHLICPEGQCPGRIGGTVVHQDQSHVTATFAAQSADALAKLLRAAGVPTEASR